MKSMRYGGLVLMVLLRAQACLGRRSFLPKQQRPGVNDHRFQVVSNIPRGGALVDVNKKLVVQCASVFTLLYGSSVSLCPEKVAKDAYAVKDVKDKLSVFLLRESGMNMLFGQLFVWSMVLQLPISGSDPVTIEKAVATAVIPMMGRSLHNLVQRTSKDLAYPVAFDLVNLSLYCLVVWTAFTDGGASFIAADKAILGMGLWNVLVSVPLFLCPQLLAGRGARQQPDLVALLSRNHGNNLLTWAVGMTAIGMGADYITAFGNCWLAGGIGIAIMTSITKDFANHDVAMGPVYFWILFMVAVGVLTSF